MKQVVRVCGKLYEFNVKSHTFTIRLSDKITSESMHKELKMLKESSVTHAAMLTSSCPSVKRKKKYNNYTYCKILTSVFAAICFIVMTVFLFLTLLCIGVAL